MTKLPDTSNSPKERRKFLRQLGAGLAFSMASPWINKLQARTAVLEAPSKSLGITGPQDEAYWEMVKKQFVIKPGMIMANAANLCPSPHFVNERVAAYAQDLASDVSFQNRAKFNEERSKAIERLARYLKVEAAEIGITRNTSESNNIVVNGLDFEQGDEVLIWSQNHPSNNVVWDQRAKRYGFKVKKIEVPAVPASEDELLKAFTDQVSSRTRLMAFSHISNVSGIALPVKKICSFASERNILTLVDGAQSLGFLDLNLKELGCDFYTSSTHKWLMGPMENGVLFAKKEHIEKLWPNIIAAGWSENHSSLDEKVCVLGQRNTPSAPAIIDILDFHEAIGTKNVEARVRYLNTYLKEQIREYIPNVNFVTPLKSNLSGGITIVSIPGKEGRVVFNQLYEQYNIACAPTGGLRLSPHIYCTSKDIDRIVKALLACVG